MSKIYIRANKSTIALYMICKLSNVDFIKMACLYEVYKEDIFYIFSVLEGHTFYFDNNTRKLKFPTESVLYKLFERASNIYSWLNYKTSVIKRYDIRVCRELEAIYKQGQFVIEVEDKEEYDRQKN